MNESPHSMPSFWRPPTSPVFSPKERVLALPRRSDGQLLGSPAPEAPACGDAKECELLQQMEQAVSEREQLVEERERRLAERERDLAEGEVLLKHHDALLRAAKKAAPVRGGLSAEEQAAVAALRAELDRQEASLREGREALREREKFIEESETRLFEKVQQQQEKETELEQREEELQARVAAAGVAGTKPPEVKRPFDEFNE